MVRDLARNCMTAELLQPDELVSGLMAQARPPTPSCVCRTACEACRDGGRHHTPGCAGLPARHSLMPGVSRVLVWC